MSSQQLGKLEFVDLRTVWNSESSDFTPWLAQKGRVKLTKPLPQHWMNISLGRSGFGLGSIANYESNEIWAEFLLSGANAKAYYEILSAETNIIESELGYTLCWHNPPDRKSCRVYVKKTVNLKAEADWPNHHQWLWERLEELHQAFCSRVKQLKLLEKD